jgi:hypothetical protein
VQHDFEQLDARSFQQFCQALLVLEHPDLVCLPVGMPDGGRDAFVERHKDKNDGGILVFQVKFVEHPGFIEDPRAWVREILMAEKRKIDGLVQRGADRYVLLTNLPASSHLDHGNVDKVRDVLADALPIPAQCLWREDLDRRLENRWDLKWSYPQLMTGVDLIHALVEGRLSEDAARRARVLRSFLADQYRNDHEVRFKQADLLNSLLDVFIDVPARVQRHRESDLTPLHQHLWELARQEPQDSDTRREPRDAYGAGSVLLDPWVQQEAQHLVVEGAPGQGKSTMLQYVCQVHRMRLLSKDADLARIPLEHRQAMARVPIRVDLRELAQWLSGVDPFGGEDQPSPPDDRSLEGFIAAMLRSASGGAQFGVSDLQAVMAVSPVFLGLDGLDEVVDIGNRTEIIEEISRAANRLAAIATSLQVVVTSRPASYTAAGRFSSPFEYLTLVSLTRRLIEGYRDRWLTARELEASEMTELKTTLNEKLDQPHFRDLCRNPMQLAIVLSLLHRKGPALPEQRTDLYRSYMEYFLDREAAKSRAVRDHRKLLLLLHGHIACLLHIEAERSPRRAGRIKSEELIRVAEEFVESRGHSRHLFEDLFGGVFDRFGALVSRVQDTFEFEVQPLREYFAGFYLYETAPYSPVGRSRKGTRPERLDAMLPHRFWLNVVRFYAGCYSVGELESLAGRLEALADNPALRLTALPRTVTAQLMADWTLAQDQRAQKRALSVVLHDLGSRHAASGEDQHSIGLAERPFVLPVQCGGDALRRALFDAAQASLPSPRVSAIARALMMNSEPGTLAEEWLARTPRDDAEAEHRWWQFGEDLGVFRAISRKTICSLLNETGDREPRLLAMVRSGVFEVLDESSDDAAVAIDYVLSASSGLRHGKSNHPLVALSGVLFLDHAVFRDSRILGHGRRLEVPIGRWPEQYDAVRVITNRYKKWQDERCSWGSQLAPWVDVVDTGRELFGERDAFDRLAICASAVRDRHQRGGGHGDLHDKTTSLVLRARHARYRARDLRWWRGQLDAVTDQRSGRIVTTLALAWASGEVIGHLEQDLNERLRRMPSVVYQQLCIDLATLASFRQGDRRLLTMVRLAKPSPRLYAAMEPRMSDKYGRELYAKLRFGSDQEDWHVVDVFLRREREMIGDSRQAIMWKSFLDLLRRANSLGMSDNGYWWFRRSLIPRDVARGIVLDAESYPLSAVAVAEQQLAQVAERASKRVGDIARRDGWFSDERG